MATKEPSDLKYYEDENFPLPYKAKLRSWKGYPWLPKDIARQWLRDSYFYSCSGLLRTPIGIYRRALPDE